MGDNGGARSCGKIIRANPVLHVSVKSTQETAERLQSINRSAIVNIKHIFNSRHSITGLKPVSQNHSSTHTHRFFLVARFE